MLVVVDCRVGAEKYVLTRWKEIIEGNFGGSSSPYHSSTYFLLHCALADWMEGTLLFSLVAQGGAREKKEEPATRCSLLRKVIAVFYARFWETFCRPNVSLALNYMFRFVLNLFLTQEFRCSLQNVIHYLGRAHGVDSRRRIEVDSMRRELVEVSQQAQTDWIIFFSLYRFNSDKTTNSIRAAR